MIISVCAVRKGGMGAVTDSLFRQMGVAERSVRIMSDFILWKGAQAHIQLDNT